MFASPKEANFNVQLVFSGNPIGRDCLGKCAESKDPLDVWVVPGIFIPSLLWVITLKPQLSPYFLGREQLVRCASRSSN